MFRHCWLLASERSSFGMVEARERIYNCCSNLSESNAIVSNFLKTFFITKSIDRINKKYIHFTPYRTIPFYYYYYYYGYLVPPNEERKLRKYKNYLNGYFFNVKCHLSLLSLSLFLFFRTNRGC